MTKSEIDLLQGVLSCLNKSERTMLLEESGK